MGFEAKILADSISPENYRLTTFELCYPRIIHAEVMTHRVCSRNTASSRAIPVDKLINSVLTNPYIPERWGKNQKGMQAFEVVDSENAERAKVIWLKSRDEAVENARLLLKEGIHKQNVNRILEPYQWHTCIISATEWNNFFKLRDHADAQPEIVTLAKMMRVVYKSSTPKKLNYDEWHLPLIDESDKDLTLEQKIKVSVGRVCRVSYVNHHGIRDYNDDIRLHDSLVANCHFSPTEHIARPARVDDIIADIQKRGYCVNAEQLGNDGGALPIGNFTGWVQYRKTIPGESGSDFVI
jgi:thymidylate synthase ThyX